MFKGALVAKGQKAMQNANKMIENYQERIWVRE